MQNFIYKSVHITVYPTWIYLERFLWLFELKFWNVVVWIDIIIVVHKEWDWDLAFAFLATDLGSVSTLVALRNSLGDLQDSDIAFRNEFNTIALFQALKFRINLCVCFRLIASLKASVYLYVFLVWLGTLEGSRARASSWLQLIISRVFCSFWSFYFCENEIFESPTSLLCKWIKSVNASHLSNWV